MSYKEFLFSRTLPLRKVQGLGGKFGEKICEDLSIQHMGDLIRFSKEELQRRYDERNGQWLYNIARGIDLEAVTPRLVSKSIGCCKKFPGRNAISAITTLNHWLTELAQEITDRLEQDELENNRRPKQMVVSFIQNINNADVSSSRTVNLSTLDVEKIVNDAIDVLKKNTDKFYKSADNCTVLNNPIKFLGLNVGKFESLDVKKGNTIQNMFQRTIDNKKNETKIESDVEETNGDGTEQNDDQPKVTESMDKIAEEKNEIATIEDSKNENDRTEDKKDDTKNSFFANYHRMRLQKQAEAEAERIAEEERKRNEENQCDESAGSDEENKFQNDMLLEELEQSNQSVQQASRSESPVPSTSSKPDYLQSYAEFYQPAIDVPKVECTQCGKKVNAHDIQIHTDEHFAFQLTQEQRVEFQSQLKRSISSTTPAAKKQKTTANSKTKTPPKIASIQKFLVQKSETDDDAVPGPSTSTASNVETEKCAECGKNIPIVDLFEHMDFHAAKKLHDELMRAEAAANRTNNNTIQNSAGKSVSTSKSKKTNKKTASNSTNKTTPAAMKNISSFFQNS